MLNLQTRTTVARCANCSRVRDKANHWAVVASYRKALDKGQVEAIILAASVDDLPKGLVLDVYDVCGSSCEQTVIRKIRDQYVYTPSESIELLGAARSAELEKPGNPWIEKAAQEIRDYGKSS